MKLGASRELSPAELVRLQLPQTMRAVIKQGLHHLSPECIDLCALAALVGREFAYDVVAHGSALSEEVLMQRFEAAVRSGVLEEMRAPELRFRFVDERVRQLLRQELSSIRARRLHFALARAIEEVYAANRTHYLSALAHHYAEGGAVQQAAAYAWEAAERAAQTFAYDEAIRHFKMVEELVQEGERVREAHQRIQALEEAMRRWTRRLESEATALVTGAYTDYAAQ